MAFGTTAKFRKCKFVPAPAAAENEIRAGDDTVRSLFHKLVASFEVRV
jgi:hypothetical protein